MPTASPYGTARRQAPAEIAPMAAGEPAAGHKVEIRHLSFWYGDFQALKDISIPIVERWVTALIGPSGCGKSTLLRCLNRMNDLIPSAEVQGELLYHGEDLYGPNVDPVQVRKLIGMVFQKPNPFPKSIYDNVAFGPRILGRKDGLDEVVERAREAFDNLGTRRKAVRELIGATQERWGPIDLFCSNAGIFTRGGLETPQDTWERMLDVNLMSQVYVARHLVPRLVERGGG